MSSFLDRIRARFAGAGETHSGQEERPRILKKNERRQLRIAAHVDAERIAREEQRRLLDLVQQLPFEARALVQADLSLALLAEPLRIETAKGSLRFALLGETSARRCANLLTKQPETIAWIDAFQPSGVFWDIGANVGPYTLYAALRSDIRVVAFEPAAVNYFLLTANCELNRFGRRVDCLPLALGANGSVAHLKVSQFEPGRSFSFRLKKRRPFSSEQAALIVSIDQLIEDYGFTCPNYIKIDVPALTEAIIEGAARTLRHPELRELHIEADPRSAKGNRIVEMLSRAGFAVAAHHVRSETSDITFARQSHNPT